MKEKNIKEKSSNFDVENGDEGIIGCTSGIGTGSTISLTPDHRQLIHIVQNILGTYIQRTDF